MRLLLTVTLVAGCSFVCGCARTVAFPWSGVASGTVRIESLSEHPVLLTGRFPTAVYADSPVETSFLLSDLSVEQLAAGDVRDGQVMHVELLWRPKPGATPLEDSATNASIRYIIFSGGEVGIYAGAGFARLRGKPGDATFQLVIRDASVRLIESTEHFADLLTPGRLTGSLNARLDPRTARQIQYAVSQLVTNAIGRSRIVQSNLDPRQEPLVWVGP